MIVYLTNVRWFRQGTDYHCHCEPARTLVWQSVPLATCPNSYRSQGETDCHVAALLAMTGGGRTLAAQNDHFPLCRVSPISIFLYYTYAWIIAQAKTKKMVGRDRRAGKSISKGRVYSGMKIRIWGLQTGVRCGMLSPKMRINS